jgi:hypothetical protein
MRAYEHVKTEDIQLEPLVNLIRKVPGLRFVEASLGHSEDPDATGQDNITHAYVGVYAYAQEGVTFLEDLSKHFTGKIRISDNYLEYFTIRVTLIVGFSTEIIMPVPRHLKKSMSRRASIKQISPYFNIEIYPAHNPAYIEIGISEKIVGIETLQTYIAEKLGIK